jgi:hypothetical protein
MNEPFYASHLKIERAKQHISDLQARILAFQASDFYTINIGNDSETGDDILHFKETRSLPDDIALIIGDALHNLKGALDIAVNEIVFSRLGHYDDFTRFPFRKTKDELINAIKGGLIHQASKTVADLIVESVKPYKGGNDALWALHELNILDKHRLLLPVLRMKALHDIRIEDDRGQPVPVGTWFFSGDSISIIPERRGNRNIKITNKGKPTLVVLFDKGLPMEGQAVLPCLVQLTEAVTGVIESIKAVFLAEG